MGYTPQGQRVVIIAAAPNATIANNQLPAPANPASSSITSRAPPVIPVATLVPSATTNQNSAPITAEITHNAQPIITQATHPETTTSDPSSSTSGQLAPTEQSQNCRSRNTIREVRAAVLDEIRQMFGDKQKVFVTPEGVRIPVTDSENPNRLEAQETTLAWNGNNSGNRAGSSSSSNSNTERTTETAANMYEVTAIVPVQLLPKSQVTTSSEITQPTNQLVPEKTALVINEIKGLLQEINTHEIGMDATKFELAMEQFKHIESAFKVDGPFGKINQMLKNIKKDGIKAGAMGSLRGHLYEIETALTLKQSGKEIIELGVKYQIERQPFREFDIIYFDPEIKKTIAIECKNITSFSPEQMAKHRSNFAMQRDIAHHKNMEYHIYFKNNIPTELAEWLTKQNITYYIR